VRAHGPEYCRLPSTIAYHSLHSRVTRASNLGNGHVTPGSVTSAGESYRLKERKKAGLLPASEPLKLAKAGRGARAEKTGR